MNQRRLWSDPAIIADRRAPAEAALGRAIELPERTYSVAEKLAARAHLERVIRGAVELRSVQRKAAR